MSWAPNDLVTDQDLRDYEAAILESFGQISWQAKRTKALEDWLLPILKSRGIDPHALRTRADVSQAFSYTASTYADKSGVINSASENDLNLATVFATAGSDALYLGYTQPFRGVFVRMLETVSSAASVLSVAYWNGSWENLLINDGTIQTAGKTFSASGSVTWLLPMDWVTRAVNNSTRYYWVKLTVSATPTGATASQIGVIKGSALRAPATFRTLQLIMMEAPTGSEGPWREKAAFYEKEADSALQRALALVGAEFDADASDQISPAEEAQTTEEVSGGPFALERA